MDIKYKYLITFTVWKWIAELVYLFLWVLFIFDNIFCTITNTVLYNKCWRHSHEESNFLCTKKIYFYDIATYHSLFSVYLDFYPCFTKILSNVPLYH